MATMSSLSYGKGMPKYSSSRSTKLGRVLGGVAGVLAAAGRRGDAHRRLLLAGACRRRRARRGRRRRRRGSSAAARVCGEGDRLHARVLALLLDGRVFESATSAFGTSSVSCHGTLMLGSSKQGKTRRAKIASNCVMAYQRSPSFCANRPRSSLREIGPFHSMCSLATPGWQRLVDGEADEVVVAGDDARGRRWRRRR